MDFTNPDDWQRAMDICQRFIRWSILCDVNNGEWTAAGVTTLQQVADLRISVQRTAEGVHIAINMPTVMQILREQDDPNVN